MIKTFVAWDVEKLDDMANTFMRQIKKNLPVRTDAVVWTEGAAIKVMHRATVFYDERFDTVLYTTKEYPEDVTKSEEKGYEQHRQDEQSQKSKSEKLGALWVQEDGSIRGNFNNNKISLQQKHVDALRDTDRVYKITIHETEAVIMKNKFKKEKRQPDYVIMRARG